MILWQNTEENWKSIIRGVAKCRVKFLFATALLVSPKQPWLAFNLTTIFCAFCLMTYFVVIGAVSMYHARDDLMAFVEISHAYTFAVAIWALIAVHYTMKIPSLHEILQMIDADVFVYKTKYGEKEDEELKTTFKNYAYLFQIFFHSIVLIAIILLTILAPLVINMFGDDERKKIEEINYDFPVPLWFPFNTNEPRGFAMAYLLILSEVSLIAAYLASAIPFLVYASFEVIAQYLILKSSILNLEARALERYNWILRGSSTQIETLRGDPLYERCVQESLKENILHHIEIMRFFNLYQDLASTIFGVIVGVSMMILASLSLVLTKVKLFSFETLKFSFFFFMELIIVFGYCFLGTSLTDSSAEIPSALYNCPWFNLNENHRRTLRVFQICSGSSIELKGSGLFVINLQLFVEIVQTTYSIFNIFSSMENA